MHFVLYTELPVKDCMAALKERMEVKPSKSRPEMAVWIEKGGIFSVAVTSQVAMFSRTTRLRGEAVRDEGVTVISGYVPGGVGRDRIALVIGAGLFVALVIALNGNSLLAIIAALLGIGISVPLLGDYNNSDMLLKELKRATRAKDKRPSQHGE